MQSVSHTDNLFTGRTVPKNPAGPIKIPQPKINDPVIHMIGDKTLDV